MISYHSSDLFGPGCEMYQELPSLKSHHFGLLLPTNSEVDLRMEDSLYRHRNEQRNHRRKKRKHHERDTESQ